MDNSFLVLSLFTAILLVQGIFYALQISHSQTEHGYGYLPMVTGIIMILIGQVSGAFILFHYDLGEWSILWLPVAMGLMLGLVSIVQWLKNREAGNLIREINENGEIDK